MHAVGAVVVSAGVLSAADLAVASCRSTETPARRLCGSGTREGASFVDKPNGVSGHLDFPAGHADDVPPVELATAAGLGLPIDQYLA